MSGRIEQRLAELKIELPGAPMPLSNFVPAVRTGNQLFIAGQTCQYNTERRFVGRLGAEITVEQGQEAARNCALNLLAQARRFLDGDLDRIRRVVRLCGFVASTPEFTEQPKVLNGASSLFVDLFGEAGRHVRTAVGSAALPGGAAVEIEAVFEIE
ncbi:MAG: RidA family protein [Stellaceae bacterium]